MRAQTSAPTTMRQLEDHARVLLIFSKTADDPQLKRQLEDLVAHASDLAERDVVVVPLPARGRVTKPTTHEASHEVSHEAFLTKPDAAQQRQRFHIKPSEFTVLLIGKDGGEKLRSSTPLTIERLSTVIDAMPMRQQEMRSKTSGLGTTSSSGPTRSNR